MAAYSEVDDHTCDEGDHLPGVRFDDRDEHVFLVARRRQSPSDELFAVVEPEVSVIVLDVVVVEVVVKLSPTRLPLQPGPRPRGSRHSTRSPSAGE